MRDKIYPASILFITICTNKNAIITLRFFYITASILISNTRTQYTSQHNRIKKSEEFVHLEKFPCNFVTSLAKLQHSAIALC